jgi:hypothetical protein
MGIRTRHNSVRRLHLAAQEAEDVGLEFSPERRDALMAAYAALGAEAVAEVLEAYTASKPSRRQVAELKRRLGVASGGRSTWDEVATTAATRR